MRHALKVLPTDRHPLRDDLANLIGHEICARLNDLQLQRVVGAVFAAAHRELNSGPMPGQLELDAG